MPIPELGGVAAPSSPTAAEAPLKSERVGRPLKSEHVGRPRRLSSTGAGFAYDESFLGGGGGGGGDPARRVRHDVSAGMPFSGVDALFALVHHAMPADPMFITALFVCETTPSREALERGLEELLVKNPRLTFVANSDASPSRWVSKAVSVGDHCTLVSLADGGRVPDDTLQEVAGDCMSQPMSLTEKPGWHQYVIPLASGKCAILTYIHHAISDGQGGVGALLSLVKSRDGSEPESWAPPAKSISKVHAKPWTGAGAGSAAAPLLAWASGLGMLLARLVYLVLAVFVACSTLSVKGLRILATRKHAFKGNAPESSAAKSTSFTRSLRLGAVREMKNALTMRWYKGSPAGGGHVTINDVMLGVLSAALAEHMKRIGKREQSLYGGVPLSFGRRGPTDRRLANLAVILPFWCPTRSTNVVDAVEQLHNSCKSMKHDAVGEAPLLWFSTQYLLALVPGFITVPLSHFLMQKMSFIMTNVPGPRETCEFAGVKIESFIPYAPSPSVGGLGCAMLSYSDKYTVGIYTDKNQDTEAGREVTRIFEEKFAELAAHLDVPKPFFDA
mmetsp:Transcript_39808/g.124392  ORF Transcript_39808/g.124392 Transcript_39808/m.124392 type:complete len:559 (-) Transcript_39808:276-1952(-)